MNYAMQIAAQGALTSLYRADVFANNLANVETDAFKPDIPFLFQRDPARIEDDLGFLPSNALLERLGAGPHLAPNLIAFKQGALQVTDGPLDVAIEGDGFFLVGSDDGLLRLSRDGRLTLDDRGILVQAATGMAVLDPGNQPIRIDDRLGPVTIDQEGAVYQRNSFVASIALVDTPHRQRLVKEGHGLYRAPVEAIDNLLPASGMIRQYAVEQSAVNEISTINNLTGALRSVGTNIGMMTYADRMLEGAVNRLGRIS